MPSEIEEIFSKITEFYDIPVRIGSRCEANVFYRVEDLTFEDLQICADYVTERIYKVCSPTVPTLIVTITGSFTEFADILSRNLSDSDEPLEVITSDKLNSGNGLGNRVKNSPVLLLNDVITTARTCLEVHTQITMMGGRVLCWGALIDRTFGPGPVSVVSSLTGAPVRLLENVA